jgi:hypothetical protein
VEPISWSDVLRIQALYALGALAFVAAGAAAAGPAAAEFVGASASPEPWLVPAAAVGVVFILAALVVAASRSEYELPVIRALLAAAALAASFTLYAVDLGLPFAVGWGLAFALAVRAPDGRAWAGRAIVLLIAGVIVAPLALLLTPVAVRTGDDLAGRFFGAA